MHVEPPLSRIFRKETPAMNQSNIALQQFLTSAGCVCPTECAEKATVGYVNASQQSHIKTGPISINIVFFTHI